MSPEIGVRASTGITIGPYSRSDQVGSFVVRASIQVQDPGQGQGKDQLMIGSGVGPATHSTEAILASPSRTYQI